MNKYRIEQINVSDTDYKLTGIYKKSGEMVKNGDIIFTYESSKADFDSYAREDGYIYYRSNVGVGGVMKIGEVVAVVSNAKLSSKEAEALFADDKTAATTEAQERIVTKKARSLMKANGIDENAITGHSIINEDIVNEYLKNSNKAGNYQNIDFYYNTAYRIHFKHGLKRLAVIGAGKAALQVYDAVLAEKKHSIVFLYDNNKKLIGQSLIDIPIRGEIDYGQIKKDYEAGLFDEIIVSFSGDIAARKKTFLAVAELKIPIANVIHPSCLISNFVNIGVGNILFANVRIGPFVEVGNNNVISSLCSIEHHNYLGSHNTFGPAVVTSGSCKIEDGNKFGTGIYVEPKINIGNDCIISSGVVIRQNVPSHSVVRNLNKIEIKPLDKE
jgi:acetyltransferase-like isoleucine patch superfamily enzyme